MHRCTVPFLSEEHPNFVQFSFFFFLGARSTLLDVVNTFLFSYLSYFTYTSANPNFCLKYNYIYLFKFPCQMEAKKFKNTPFKTDRLQELSEENIPRLISWEFLHFLLLISLLSFIRKRETKPDARRNLDFSFRNMDPIWAKI